MSSAIKHALEELGIGTLFQNFIAERVDDESFKFLSDADLSRLGVSTIGERIKVKENVRKFMEGQTGPNSESRALSILQNGKIPVLEPEIIEELFNSSDPRPAIKELRSGMDALGLIKIGKAVPSFIHLIRPKNVKLTYKKLVNLLKPEFHETGSNTRKLESKVYAQFLAYAREAASGRRDNISLNHILLFATGTDEEPALGYSMHPSIQFPQRERSFLPTANTCINRLSLPRPGGSQDSLPGKEDLFNLYDFAFSNAYFGLN